MESSFLGRNGRENDEVRQDSLDESGVQLRVHANSTQERGPVQRLSLDGEKMRTGLVKLVLTLIEVLRELMERQAVRRVESGSLSSGEVEKLGLALMQIKRRMGEIEEEFGFDQKDLDIDLGPLGQLRNGKGAHVSLTDVLDKVIDEGAVVAGEVLVSVANVDLVSLNLLLSLSSVHKMQDRICNGVE
jgi:Gas vesicle protein K/Gas vesicle protein